MTAEQQEFGDSLTESVAKLKKRFPRTQDLYREVCILMFFHHGITPSANKLYQLVRKGSMSAPTQAVQEFWERLREQSRVTVDHATLPDELKAAAGELVATLWQSAQTMSQDMLAGHQAQSAAEVAAARAAEMQAQAEHASTRGALELALSQVQAQEQVVDTLRQELSRSAAANAGLEARLEELRRQVTNAQEESERIEQAHTLELDKLSGRTALAEHRFVEMEKRALIEIDRERTSSAKLQKTLDAERAAHLEITERLRIEHNAAQGAIGQLREQVGALQNGVKSLETERQREREELVALRLRLETAVRQGAADQARAEQLQAALERHRTEVERSTGRSGTPGSGKRRRKPSPAGEGKTPEAAD
jgi:predicted DCC family thiol-disulfide oxidoreductase YuxK